jgi:uncharacterized protein
VVGTNDGGGRPLHSAQRGKIANVIPDPTPAQPTTLTQTLALAPPRGPHWPLDKHLLLALLAAVPVWLALGLWAGPRMLAPATLWAWCSLVLVQPLLEELVFRGLLQGQALNLLARQGKPMRAGPVTLANLLVTLAFVALHLMAQPLAWAIAVAVPSLVFGHLRERFSSVWPAVVLHALYNAGFGLTAWLASSSYRPTLP